MKNSLFRSVESQLGVFDGKCISTLFDLWRVLSKTTSHDLFLTRFFQVLTTRRQSMIIASARRSPPRFKNPTSLLNASSSVMLSPSSRDTTRRTIPTPVCLQWMQLMPREPKMKATSTMLRSSGG